MKKTIVCAFVEEVPQENILDVCDALDKCKCTITKIEPAGNFKLAVSYYFYGNPEVAAVS